MDYISELKNAIRHNHGCDSQYVQTVHVTEYFQGGVAWDGNVEIFNLFGHPQTNRCYGWGYSNPQRGGLFDYVTVLDVWPVNSPQTAVKAVIVATAKQRQSKK